MQPLLNTLYVTSQGAYLAKSGLAVQVRLEKKTLAQLPLHTLEAIACFGRVGVSPFVLGACAEAGVAVAFLTEREAAFLAAVRRFHSRETFCSAAVSNTVSPMIQPWLSKSAAISSGPRWRTHGRFWSGAQRDATRNDQERISVPRPPRLGVLSASAGGASWCPRASTKYAGIGG